MNWIANAYPKNFLEAVTERIKKRHENLYNQYLLIEETK